MTLLLIAFIAGILTVLAPCILPLLPVIIGGSVTGASRKKVYTIIISLILSIVAFTLLLKSSTLFVHISPNTWTDFSGILIGFVGLTMVFPGVWERMPGINKLSQGGNKLVGEGYQKNSFWGDVIIGAALGPVFSSCSPTYFVILATVLPSSLAKGILYLFVYAIGLGLSLLAISVIGQKIMGRLTKFSDPNGWAKRIIGILFVLVGILVFTGGDKTLEAGILSHGFFDVTQIETKLLEAQPKPTNADGTPSIGNIPTSVPQSILDQNQATSTSTTPAAPGAAPTTPSYLSLAEKALIYPKYKEIVDPGGFVNTGGLPITIGQYVGKKVILLDILDYSCINCQRTFPYLVQWNKEYEDKGLVIIGIHTPEFAFEHDINNVTAAMKQFGITFPVVLDNDYGTWNAYQNEYWPHKYLIDIDGYVVYDHIGEGGYDETEQKIVDLLNERATRLGLPADITTSNNAGVVAPVPSDIESPETYIGSDRTPNDYGDQGMCTGTTCTFPPISAIPADSYALGGTWDIQPQYAEMTSDSGSITYDFRGKDMYIVASAATPVVGTVLFDGKPIDPSIAGADVVDGKVAFSASRLYNIVNLSAASATPHTVTIELPQKGLQAYSFTFG